MADLLFNNDPPGSNQNDSATRLRMPQHGPWADGTGAFIFSTGILLHVIFFIAEGVAGFELDSVALLADAARNLGSGLCLSLAGWYGRPYPGRGQYPYSFNRLPLQASVCTALGLSAVLGFLLLATIDRLRQPQPVDGLVVGLVAGAGLLLHAGTAVLLVRGPLPWVNLRSGCWYLFTDALVSLGMGLGAALIYYTGWEQVDPLLALGLLGITAYGSRGLLAPSRLLRAQALDINEEEVHAFLLGQPGVREVQQLRIWALSLAETALSVHLVRPRGDDSAFVEYLQEALEKEFNIRQATVQLNHETTDSNSYGYGY